MKKIPHRSSRDASLDFINPCYHGLQFIRSSYQHLGLKIRAQETISLAAISACTPQHACCTCQVEEGEEGTQMNSTTPNIMAIYSALQTPRIGLTPIPSPTPVPAVSVAPTYTSIGVGTNTAPG